MDIFYATMWNITSDIIYNLLHHGVFKEDKIRVVFNGSASTINNF